jgi:mannose-6-phosphate isomerase-like protein (cupin superfamily)
MNEQEVKKEWGGELWFANNEKYCGKLLWVDQWRWSSSGKFHYHKIKDETFLCIEGDLVLEYEEDGVFHSITLQPQQSFRIFPGTKHRFSTRTIDGCKFIEASTTHKEEDSYRCEFIDGEWVE